LSSGAVEGDHDGQKPVGSKAALAAAINAAKAVRDNTKATQTEVDDAITALQAAEQTFTDAVVNIIYTALDAAIDEAKELLDEANIGQGNGDYSQAAADALDTAIGKAETVAASQPTQTRVDNGVVALQAAVAAFKKTVVVVNYAALNSAITVAQGILSDATYDDKYSSGAKATFEAALSAAEAVSADTNATQTDVNDAANALIQAQKALLLTIGVDGLAIEGVVVYPNPAENYIQVAGIENGTVAIYASNGALVKTVANYYGEAIDIASLAAGAYIVDANGVKSILIKK
jgi:hypothetical protein